MADTKRFGALLIAAAACVGLTAAYADAEHRAINITGDLQFDAVSRRGTTTFSSAAGLRNPSADAGNVSNTGGTTSDESDLIMQKVYLNFGFDLSTNAKAMVQLGMKGLAGNNTDNTNTGAGAVGGGDSSFNARIRQAYVELHEVFVPQLGLRLGMQDMVKGLDRGDNNHFVMYSPGWGKHFQIRDGGRVERAFSTRARGQNLPANSALGFDDLNSSDTGTFAWVAMFEQKDMYSAELFYVALEEDGNGLNQAYLWGADAKMPLKMINDKSLLTAHAFNVKDNTILQSELTAATKEGSGSNFWQYGLGANLFFQDNFEAYGEFAVQTGKFAEGVDQTGTVSPNTDIGQEKTQDAYAYYLGAKVMIPGAADFKPSLDVSFWSYSGDDDQNDNDNSGFINYGDNKSTMVVEENEYGIGLSNNYNVWRFKGALDLGGLGTFTKGRKTPLAVSYHVFDVNETRVRGALMPTTANPQQDGNPNSFGTEWDFSLSHDYSENVTFKLGYGIFFPGMYVRENSNLSANPEIAAVGTPGPGAGDGSAASVLVFTTSVKF